MKKTMVFALFLLPASLFADEVFLKGAGKISGQIVARTDTQVTIDIGAGTVTIPMSRVDRIEEGQSALAEYRARARQLSPNDVDGWRALGAWASARGLNTQAREAYEKVHELNPNDPAANKELGRVQQNGRWVSEEEAYREQGYVQFEGVWMSPSEGDAIRRERAESDARRQSEQRAREAEARAAEAEARAKKAEASAEPGGLPLYWSWGVGPAAWPSFREPPPAQEPE